MRAAIKLGGFALGLGASFGVAYGAGQVIEGLDEPPRAARNTPDAGRTWVRQWPVGMTISHGGYSLRPADTRLHDHGNPLFAFSVTGPDGAVVKNFTPVGAARRWS